MQKITTEELEDNRIKKENKEITAFVNSDGWKIVKQKLTDLVLDLQDINTISEKTADQVFTEIRARKQAVQTLMLWLRQVEGTAYSIDNEEETAKSLYVTRE